MRLTQNVTRLVNSLLKEKKILDSVHFFQRYGNRKIKIKNGGLGLTCQVLLGEEKPWFGFGKPSYFITDDTDDLSDKNSPKTIISCLFESSYFDRQYPLQLGGTFVLPQGIKTLDSGGWTLTDLEKKYNLSGFLAIVPLDLITDDNLKFFYLTEKTCYQINANLSWGLRYKLISQFPISKNLLENLGYEDILRITNDPETLKAYTDARQAKSDLANTKKAAVTQAKQQREIDKRLKGTKRL